MAPPHSPEQVDNGRRFVKPAAYCKSLLYTAVNTTEYCRRTNCCVQGADTAPHGPTANNRTMMIGGEWWMTVPGELPPGKIYPTAAVRINTGVG